MKTFKDYCEDKETQEIFNESFGSTVATIIGKILGIGTAGVLSAWAAALLFKGGMGAINSFSKTMGQDGITFKKNFKNANKDSPAVQKEMNRMDQEKKKHEEELYDVLRNIKDKNWSAAGDEFHKLPTSKQNSTEIRRVVIEEVVRTCQQIPSSEPTPGNECYRAIRRITDMATAKAIAKEMQIQAQKYLNIGD